MKKEKIRNILNYVIVILIIFLTCSPFFLSTGTKVSIFLLILLTIIALIAKKRLLSLKIFLALAASWILIIIQGFVFQGFTPAAVYQPLIVLYTPFLVYTIMGISYFRYLFKIIYFIAIYTSIIYLLQVFVPEFNAFLSKAYEVVFPYSWSDYPRSILIYSIPRESGYFLSRNSGIFHEPGAYAVYLILAIIINTIISRKAINVKNIFLSLVLLSTFSTVGYLMLFLVLTYSIWSLKINIFFRAVILLLFLSFSLSIFQNNEFLQKKIEGQYKSDLNTYQKGEKQLTGRFYFFAQGTKTFLSSPIFGRGILAATINAKGVEGIGGLGFISLFARYGIIFGIYYMWFFFKGLRMYSEIFKAPKLYIFLVFIVLNIGLLSQSFFFHISFVMFFIIGLFYPERATVNFRNYGTLHSPISKSSLMKERKATI